MVKRYNIQLSELDNLLDMFCAYSNDEDVMTDIENLKIFIERLKKSFNTPKQDSTIERIAVNLGQLSSYNRLFPYIKVLLNKGMYFSDSVDPDYEEINLSHVHSIDLCRDFFLEQGSFFSDAFDEYSEDIEDRLMFIEPNENCDGEIHYLKTTGDAFLLAPDHKDIRKATILTHEFEHVIDCFNNHNFYKNTFIREISAMFMEMIGCDHLAKKLGLHEDCVSRRYHIHSIVKANAFYIPDKMELMRFMNKHRDMDEKSIIKEVDMVLKYDKDYVDYLLGSYLSEDYYYPISYMIAIELYTIYNEDKDKALYILMDIIMNGTDENIFNILKKYNINIGNNIVSYEQDMCLKLGI